MDLGLILADAHHLAVFTLVGLFAAEFALVRPGLDASRIRQLARLDLAYGAIAGLVIVVGVLRVIYGGAGWDYYVSNLAFWGKMIAFAAVGVLTLPPTLAFRRWLKAVDSDANDLPSQADIAQCRRFLHLQALALLLIPLFAAAMARGYGS